MRALLTDLYQLTMTAGYWRTGKAAEVAVFEMFARRLPPNRDFLVVAGLEQALEYLEQLRFQDAEIAYLRRLPQFERVETEFWEYLREFRFRGNVYAMAEGTVAFAGEPLLAVEACLPEAQIPETYLLATIGFQTIVASKAARILAAADGRGVVEFGCRRAHSPEAGCLGGRAAYLAGCAGTSNVEAGFRYGIPVFGTAAHSWVMSFETEKAAFACLQELLGERTVQLIDSYDTLEGAREAVRLGKPLWGVRLDSGDLLALSQEVRKILDDAGLFDAKIMATNDLDEKTIGELVRGGAPIDIFGVGTSLATSYDAPALGCVYKLVEHHAAGRRRLPFKQSEGKRTLPGRKQVYRFADYDFVALEEESAPEGGVALLAPVMKNGARMTDPTPMETIQAYARQQIRDHGRAGRAIEYSSELRSWGANA